MMTSHFRLHRLIQRHSFRSNLNNPIKACIQHRLLIAHATRHEPHKGERRFRGFAIPGKLRASNMAFIQALTLQNMLQNSLRQLPHQGLTVAMSLARNHEISILNERIKPYLIQKKLSPRTSLCIEILQESIAQASGSTSPRK